jgi:hypothetical protein
MFKPTSWLYETRIGTHKGLRRAGPDVGSPNSGSVKSGRPPPLRIERWRATPAQAASTPVLNTPSPHKNSQLISTVHPELSKDFQTALKGGRGSKRPTQRCSSCGLKLDAVSTADSIYARTAYFDGVLECAFCVRVIASDDPLWYQSQQRFWGWLWSFM